MHNILRGDRWPQVDVIIALWISYRMKRIVIDEILPLANLPPLDRRGLREYRQQKLGVIRK